MASRLTLIMARGSLSFMIFSIVLAAMSPAAAPAAPPADPVVLTAKGPWRVAVAENECRMGRVFESKGREIVVQFRPSGGSTSYRLVMLGHSGLVPDPRRGTPAMVSVDATLSEPLGGIPVRLPNGTVLLRGAMSDAFMRAITPDARRMTIVGPSVAIDMPVDGTAEAVDRLDACYDDRLRAVGVDPRLFRENRLAQLLNPGRLFSEESFARVAGNRPARGQVMILVTVTAAGSITGCRVLETPTPELGEATCRIVVEGGQAKPAVGADGKPIDGYALLPVRWVS